MVKKRGKKKKIGWKEIVIVTCLVLVVGLNLINYFIIRERAEITGHDISSIAHVGFAIVDNDAWFIIIEPENITYNFTNSEPLVLNLTGISSEPFDSWVYHIYDNFHDEWAYENVSFGSNTIFPNITIPVVRKSNTLFVVGTLPSGEEITQNVTFYVNVTNSSPIITRPIKDPLYVCENEILSYDFNATDVDEDILSSNIVVSSPHFHIYKLSQNRERAFFELFSDRILKTDSNSAIDLNDGFREYLARLEVTDGGLSDYEDTTIIVLEINNPPQIHPNLVTKTLWNKGENSSWYVDINFSDVEANLGWGSLVANFSLVNMSDGAVYDFMNMSSTGIINFTADNSTPVGNYLGTVCVSDAGLLNDHTYTQVMCDNNPKESQVTCDNFQLTITDENRAPTIVLHSPENNETLNFDSTYRIFFNVTEYDPDETNPDTYWFVDDVLKEFDEGALNDSFNYSFGCGVSGFHTVRVVATDGELNDSLVWNITLKSVACPKPDEGGGGGGGGGGGAPTCQPKWVCNPWVICQHAQTSLDLGLISGDSYRFIKDECDENYFSAERCGYQTRVCVDNNNCSTQRDKPIELQYCLFTANPTCGDGIQNCHDGLCELLVDCGGPCSPCSSCSDGKKNQGEEGVDCGGPCPWQCEPEVPLLQKSKTIYIFLIILLIIIILIIIKLIRVLKYKKAIEERKKGNV